jgi:hypothetical protein
MITNIRSNLNQSVCRRAAATGTQFDPAKPDSDNLTRNLAAESRDLSLSYRDTCASPQKDSVTRRQGRTQVTDSDRFQVDSELKQSS